MDAVLVGLYEEPEKPDNPLEFVKQFLGGGGEVDVEALKRENDELKKKVSDLETQLNDLKTRGATSAAPAPPAEVRPSCFLLPHLSFRDSN